MTGRRAGAPLDDGRAHEHYFFGFVPVEALINLSDVEVVSTYESRKLTGTGQVSLGEVNAKSQVVGCRRFHRP